MGADEQSGGVLPGGGVRNYDAADADITSAIIGAGHKVLFELGCGFLEKVYERALVLELGKRGILCETQKRIEIFYDNVSVGEYCADLLVAGCVIVEVKVATAIIDAHFAQCMNYLKATKLRTGLILNFGNSKLEIQRVANGWAKSQPTTSPLAQSTDPSILRE